jgi:hypothetical protein
MTWRVAGEADFDVELNSSSEVISRRVDILEGKK